MKMLGIIFSAALLLPVSVLAQTQFTYSNLNSSTASDNGGPNGVGWGSCVTCAGGDPNGTASIATNPFFTSPSLDGASRDFYISGSPYTNGLFWYKVGPNDAVSHFKMDFWLNVGSDTQNAQALEFDTFQFNQQNTQFPTGTEYMFGTQCNYFAGVWDIWDMGNSKWSHTWIPCYPFQPNTWYHITLNFHTSSRGRYQNYDSLNIVQYDGSGRRVLWRTSNRWNIAVAAGPMPAGWTENMGMQFQMDLGYAGGSMTEYVDKVSLTAW